MRQAMTLTEMDALPVGTIWCEPDATIVGKAGDGQVVQLGMALLLPHAASRKPGYTIFPADAHTRAYLAANPNPEKW